MVFESIAIGSEHRGFSMKQELIGRYEGLGIRKMYRMEAMPSSRLVDEVMKWYLSR